MCNLTYKCRKSLYSVQEVKENKLVMKRYIRAATHKEWQSHLTSGVYQRLCECTTTKKDIPQLARCFWNYKAKEDGMTEQECLDYILTWVLDWNGSMWDYTEDEYDDWLSQIYPRRR